MLLETEAGKEINRLLARKKEVRVLDIGCGNGAVLIRLALKFKKNKKVKFKGVDLSKAFVDYGNIAAKYKGLAGTVSFEQLDIEKSDLKGKYDVILSSEVLEHLQEAEKFLMKVVNSLKKGGVLLLSTPNSNNWAKYPLGWIKGLVIKINNKDWEKQLIKKEEKYKLSEQEQHIKVFGLGELKNLLEKAGLKVYASPRSTSFFGGKFLDDAPLLLGLSMIADSVLNLLPINQVGWDLIVFSRKR